MAPVFNIILQGFDFLLLENASECNHRVTWGSELKWDVSNSV